MRLFYPRFAIDAIRKNKRSYIPYILTTAFVVAMYDILRSLSLTDMFQGTFGASTLSSILGFGSQVIAIFSIIFLFYTSSFLMKQRKQEFGLYSVLGMEKRHICRILLFETLFIAAIGVVAGLVLGSIFNWAAFLLLMNMLGGNVHAPFSLSFTAMRYTIALFAVIFLLIFLNNLRQVQLSSVISLLNGSSEGEREPRSKWPLTVFGLLFLGIGYTMALLIKNPIGALIMFFVAVVLVILGTYCLFTSGSIVLLKLLRRKKNYYYKTKHFISVSGMLYRMKQNAISLGNICILSTMVLVTVSSTMSLYSGCDDLVSARYPRELNLTIVSSDLTPVRNDLAFSVMDEMLHEQGVSTENEAQISYLSFGAAQHGDQFLTSTDDASILDELTSVVSFSVVPVSDYNRLTGAQISLAPGEVLLYSRDSYSYHHLEIFGQHYQIRELLETFPCAEIVESTSIPTFIITVADAEFDTFNKLQREAYGENASQITTYRGVDVGNTKAEAAISQTLQDRIEEESLEHAGEEWFDWWICRVESRTANQEDFLEMYGGLFFVGIFLGLLFLIATILIIYYKQLSEGLQDRKRYSIMRKVGLTDKEIRSSIHSQVLTVFFLPLITAFIHTAFAFPMVNRCLRAINMTNVSHFLLCLVLCCGIFAIFYLFVYVLTSKVYYKIINQPEY